MHKCMIVFPGQGSQYVGMYNKVTSYATDSELYIHKAKEVTDLNLYHICEELDEAELTKTSNAQPAIFFVSYIAYRWLKKNYDIEPIFFAGHSLGELTALTCSGAMTFEDGIRLVKNRGIYMNEVSQQQNGAMAAIINAPIEQIKKVCNMFCTDEQYVGIANYNSPKQVVISGYEEGVEKVCLALQKEGIRTKRLKVSGAFHSPYMSTAQNKLAEQIDKLPALYFSAPVISNYSAKPYSEHTYLKDNLTNQLISGVQWCKTIEYAKKMGVNCIIEVGPGKVLKNLMHAIDPSIKVYSLDEPKDFEALGDILNKREIESEPYNAVIERALALSVCIKNESLDEHRYRQDVIPSYECLKSLSTKISEGYKATKEEAIEAMSLFKKIMIGKGASLATQKARIYELLYETDTIEILEGFLNENE